MGHVYILELQGGKWYVGWSADLSVRIASHFIGAGSKWTMLYPPVAVHSIRPGDKLLETLTTIALMCTHGWENVRGGSYCTVEMSKAPACITKAKHYASYKTPNAPNLTGSEQAPSSCSSKSETSGPP